MPRGEHFKKVEDEQIISVFDRDDLNDRFGRKLLKSEEVAQVLNEDILDGETITREAARQRMHKIDKLETEEFGNAVLWKKKGAEVFAGGFGTRQSLPSIYNIPDLIAKPLSVAGVVFMLLVAAVLGFVNGYTPTLGSLAIAAVIGAVMPLSVVYLSSAFIAVYQWSADRLNGVHQWVADRLNPA